MKTSTVTPLLKNLAMTKYHDPASETKHTETKKYRTLGEATTNSNGTIPRHLQTYTAGEDSSRLASSAKELGLARQRQKRTQVRRVGVTTKEAGVRDDGKTENSNNKDERSTIRGLDLRETRSSIIRQQQLSNDDDPFDLGTRFVYKQKLFFSTALQEIRHGSKRGCWLWFIIPTPPYIVNGEERGSSMNRKYALRGDDCVKAYLEYQDKTCGVNLRRNYLTMARTIQMQLQNGKTLSSIFGPMDEMKVISSLTLFERIAAEKKDEELAEVCRRVLLLSKSVRRTNNFRPNSPMWI